MLMPSRIPISRWRSMRLEHMVDRPDCALRPLREQTKARPGFSTTEAGALLKRQIAIRTFSDWTAALER